MPQTFSARRRNDGTIDFDFYRTRAVALRGQAIRDAATLRLAGTGIGLIVTVFPLTVAAAALVAAFL